jgi:hypothetical protein
MMPLTPQVDMLQHISQIYVSGEKRRKWNGALEMMMMMTTTTDYFRLPCFAFCFSAAATDVHLCEEDEMCLLDKGKSVE